MSTAARKKRERKAHGPLCGGAASFVETSLSKAAANARSALHLRDERHTNERKSSKDTKGSVERLFNTAAPTAGPKCPSTTLYTPPRPTTIRRRATSLAVTPVPLGKAP